MKKYISYMKLLLVISLGFCAHLTSQAQSQGSNTENRLKVAFVYNFAKYVEWVSSENKNYLAICLIGKEDLNGAFNALNGRSTQGKEIQVKRNITADQVKDCQIVYVPEAEAKLIPTVMKNTSTSSILVVTDAKAQADSVGHIHLDTVEDRIQFDVNLPLMQKSNLKASSEMLKLARSTRIKL
jgi:hypothetical protein